VNRGDVYWYTFRHPDKRRPVVILTLNRAIPHLNAVVVAAVTSTIRHVPTEVLVGPEDGMPTIGAVNLHHIHSAAKSELEKFICHLNQERMEEIREAITISLGLEETI
jgi:mRNA interferase MazF